MSDKPRPCARCGFVPRQVRDKIERDPGLSVMDKLTEREKQTCGLLCRGYTNRRIALALGTVDQVIKNRLRSIYDKTGMGDRLELALFVISSPALKAACEYAVTQLEQML